MIKGLEKEGYKLIKTIKNNEVFMLQKECNFYILKTHKKISGKLSKLHGLMNHINNYHFTHTYIPKIIDTFEDEKNPYYITEYIAGKKLQRSEYDDDNRGGKSIHTRYADIIYKAILDLEKIDITKFELEKNYKNKFLQIDKRLQYFYDKKIIGLSLVKEIIHLCKKNRHTYFDNTIISNLDFYIRNILITEKNKVVIIDWDGPPTCESFGLQVTEELLMYFYVTMFGNQKFQDTLLALYKKRKVFDIDKFRIGLILSILLDMEIWYGKANVKKSFDQYVYMLSNYKKIIS